MTSYPHPATAAPDVGPSDDPPVKERASESMDQGRQAAGDLAGSAAEHAREVKDETVRQARDLIGEARQHVGEQAGDQHRNLVANLRALSSELGSMVERSEQRGTATELVGQARERVDGVASWLDNRQPGDVLGELKSFARRRPGTFLVGALAAGVVAGRLTRGAVDAHADGSGANPAGGPSPAGQHEAPAPAAGDAMGGNYAEPAQGAYPGSQQGYGATSTYGSGGTRPMPSGGYPDAGAGR